ncbi:hypothetical protein LTR86_011004 [Recurvomyces mirabilis]|nr:hypothetical protein LTR86_011004 [Recurvomyces mirabilis]
MDYRTAFPADSEEDDDRKRKLYQELHGVDMDVRAGPQEQVRTSPLMSLTVKDTVRKSLDSKQHKIFDQYAVLGFHAGEDPAVPPDEPILINIDAPNSFFICGSQGSGKSYTLNCILEGCLLADERIGCVRLPIAGVAFHFNDNSAGEAAETAYVCSAGVRIRVLVSQSNEYVLRQAYSRLPGAQQFLTVEPLLLHPSDLSVERMHRLMAFSDNETSMPLYMSVALRVLRRMAIDANGEPFDYFKFKKILDDQNFTKDQAGPLNLRLELLESFMNIARRKGKQDDATLFTLDPGTLTIVDLTDPFMDPGTACVLFDICLSLVQERRPICGMVVALDEAHKYMTASLAAANFTRRLLGTIREQRHNGTRVIIATQEPTISDSLLDLCTTSIIHRFTSPAWFKSMQSHLGAASSLVSTVPEQQALFDQIMELDTGHSLVFSPAACMCLSETGTIGTLGRRIMTMKTRIRIGQDGGMSVLAAGSRYPSGVQSSEAADSENSVVELGRSSAADEVTVAVADAFSLSDDEKDEMIQQGVSVAQSCEYLLGARDTGQLDRERSQLVLICCLCEKLVAIEYPAVFLPGLNGTIQETLRSGLAYSTCVQCQLKHVPESKKATKTFDMAKGKEFLMGKVRTSKELREAIRSTFRLILQRELTVLRREGDVRYLFARVIQRSVRESASIWTVDRICAGVGTSKAILSRHRDGSFFKSSLQPHHGLG